MEINFHVLGALVLNRVGDVDSTDVVAVDEADNVERLVEILKPRDLSDTICNARYSALALDRETVGCRLEDQDTRIPPRKTCNQRWNDECQGIRPNQHRCKPQSDWEQHGE
jgi:hypothetical protein